MNRNYLAKIYKALAIYYAILFVIAVLILMSGCATRLPLGSYGKYGTVGVDVSYYPPSEFQGVFPPSYLPNHYKK